MNKYPFVEKYVTVDKVKENKYRVINTKIKKSYIIGQDEMRVLRECNANNTITMITEKFVDINSTDIKYLLSYFEEIGLVNLNSIPIKNKKNRFIFNYMNKNMISVVANIINYGTYLIFLITMFLLVISINEIQYSQSSKLQHIVLIIALPLSVIFHELGHVLVLKQNNCSILKKGIKGKAMSIYGFVSFVGISEVVVQSKERQIYIAGCKMNLLIIMFMLLKIIATKFYTTTEIVIIIANFIMIVFSLIPLNNSDGLKIIKTI